MMQQARHTVESVTEACDAARLARQVADDAYTAAEIAYKAFEDAKAAFEGAVPPTDKPNGQHSPLPWVYFEQKTWGGPFDQTYPCVRDGRGGVMMNGCGPGGTEEAKANIRLIVRACNAHDDLLAACKETALYLKEVGPEESAGGNALLATLCAAIYQAEKGE